MAAEKPAADAKAADKLADKPGEAKEAIKPALPPIVLIVPAASKTFGKVADAVRLGFLAGAAAEGRNAPPFRVVAADDEAGSLAAQYRKAAGEGAAVIVGGVTRDGANVLAREASYVPTLALNAPGGTADNDLPERFFHVSLSLDWEARLAARAAVNDGLRRAALVTAGSALAKRVQESFEKEWMRLGGEIAVRIPYTGESADAARVTSALDKAHADVAFLTVDFRAARQARPYLPAGMPVFATSFTIDPRGNTVDNLDLDSVRFMEMPWFVESDHPAVMTYQKPGEPMPIDYERLYALGIDAWRLAQMVASAEKPKRFAPLDGVTGRIQLEGHQFTRMLSDVEMRDGRPTIRRAAE